MIAAALEGRVEEQYEGGPAGRERQIQEGAGRSGAALVDDVRASAEQLRATWGALPDEAWALTQYAAAGTRTIADGLRSRWREVEVHFVDLDMLYTSEQWPQAFVDLFLPRTIKGMMPNARGLPAGASWSLRDETSGEVWFIDVSGARLSTEAATHQIVGPGHALLAWLLGRSFSAAIRVECSPNENAALLLPRFFPNP